MVLNYICHSLDIDTLEYPIMSMPIIPKNEWSTKLRDISLIRVFHCAQN